LHGFFVLGRRHLQNAKRGRLEQNPSFSADKRLGLEKRTNGSKKKVDKWL
jgi:hypothetical protein